MKIFPESVAIPERSVSGDAKLFANREVMLSIIPKYSVCVEVGVAYGSFTATMLSTLKPSLFYAIDCFGFAAGKEPWGNTLLKDSGLTHEEWYRRRFVEQMSSDTLRVIKGMSWDACESLKDDVLDYAYLDADHAYISVVRDLKVLYRKVKHNGLITFNDYTLWDFGAEVQYGVVQVVNRFLAVSKSKIVSFALQASGYHDITVQIDKSTTIDWGIFDT